MSLTLSPMLTQTAVPPTESNTIQKPFIKIAIADDHLLFTKGIGEFINTAPGMEFCRSFTNGKALLDWYDGSNADVLLIDLQMPVLDGIETSRRLLARFPKAGIIILSVNDDLKTIQLMHEIGVCAYVVKTADPDYFIQTIIKVHAGEKVFPDGLAASDGDEAIPALKISGREMQVLKLIVAGLTNVMIAKELNLSKLTVKKHREHLMRKLQASNTAQLIANAGLKRIL